jgi:hypothetical protein
MESKHFTVLTEEYPNIDEIHMMMKSIGESIQTAPSNDDIIPIITFDGESRKFEGKWSLKYDEIDIIIMLFKGTTSSVDYMLFNGDYNLDKGDAGEALVILESTKTSDSSSRNTAVFQRITKFTTYDSMYPNSNAIKVMFWCNSIWKDTLTPTAEIGMRLMVTLNICIYSHHNGDVVNIKDKYNVNPYYTCDEFIESKNNIKQKAGNESIRLRRVDNNIYISLKLDKGKGNHAGIISHDPNVGFLTAVLNALVKISIPEQNRYIIENHNISQTYFDKCPNSKLWYSINGIPIEFDGCVVKHRPHPPDTYFTIENKMTEKLATILCDMTSSDKTIFSNHGGCALTCVKGINGEENVGRKMPRPDIVFANNSKRVIIIIEGKLEKELSKGLKQLSDTHLHGFIEIIKKLYPGYTIIKGLCITISDIAIIDKYSNLEFPVLFALDNDGHFIDLR